MKITVAGLGYVGLSNAILLSQHNEVYAIDIDEKRVNMINNRRSPIIDPEIDQFLKRPELNLTATVDAKKLTPELTISLLQHLQTTIRSWIILIHHQ